MRIRDPKKQLAGKESVWASVFVILPAARYILGIKSTWVGTTCGLVCAVFCKYRPRYGYWFVGIRKALDNSPNRWSVYDLYFRKDLFSAYSIISYITKNKFKCVDIRNLFPVYKVISWQTTYVSAIFILHVPGGINYFLFLSQYLNNTLTRYGIIVNNGNHLKVSKFGGDPAGTRTTLGIWFSINWIRIVIMPGYRDRYRHGLYSVDVGVQRAEVANLGYLFKLLH